MNDVKLSGRLTRDPELKQTPNGVPVATFALAVDRKFNREEADFIPVTTWRKTAEFVAKYFRKGQRVIIASGRIRVDPYTDKDGKGTSSQAFLFCCPKRNGHPQKGR